MFPAGTPSFLRAAYGSITDDMAYLAILPGAAIVIMVLAFMLVGNGLRDALDTKTMDDMLGA